MDTSRRGPGRPESVETVMDEIIVAEIARRDNLVKDARDSDERAKDMVRLRQRFEAAKKRQKAGAA